MASVMEMRKVPPSREREHVSLPNVGNALLRRGISQPIGGDGALRKPVGVREIQQQQEISQPIRDLSGDKAHRNPTGVREI